MRKLLFIAIIAVPALSLAHEGHVSQSEHMVPFAITVFAAIAASIVIRRYIKSNEQVN